MNKEFKIGQRVWSKEYKELATVIDDSYFETCRIKFDDGKIHSVFNIDLHQTADDMFEELDFYIKKENEYYVLYQLHTNNMLRATDAYTYDIWFDKKEPRYEFKNHEGGNNLVNLKLHQAIHQKMIELGWIE